jgi:hypothetical protein
MTMTPPVSITTLDTQNSTDTASKYYNIRHKNNTDTASKYYNITYTK